MKKVQLLSFILVLLWGYACDPIDTTVRVEGITIDPTRISLLVDETHVLTINITPEEATDKNVTWYSSDNTIASVNDGYIEAKNPGVTYVSATTIDGEFSAVCEVTVTSSEIEVSEIILGKTQLTLKVGESESLSYTILPVDASNQNLSWSSSDESIVSVSDKGLVNAINQGQATITATTNNGYSANCVVTVISTGTITKIMDFGTLTTKHSGSGVDLCSDDQGNTYLAINAKANDLTTNASVEVWKYNGTKWSQFTDRVDITDDESPASSIAIDKNGMVYVAYQYYNENDKRHMKNVVAQSDGTNWSIIGGEGNSCLIMDGAKALNGASELAFKNDGTLLIAHVEYGDGFVHYFDETWKSYNSYKTDSPNLWAGGINIDCHGNTPYVSIRTSSGDGKCGVLKGSDNNGEKGEWQWLGNSYASLMSHDAQFQDEILGDASLAINSAGDIFTSYQAYGSDGSLVMVRKYSNDGTAWETLLNMSKDNTEQTDVVISSDQLYLVVANYNKGVEIYKFNEDNSWGYEGIFDVPDVYYAIKTSAGNNGEFFIAVECTNKVPGRVGVFKYTPAIHN